MPAGEGQASLRVGISGEVEVPGMVGVVVVIAQATEIPGVGWSTVGPVDDVMALDVGAGASGEAAAAVAVLDQSAGPVGDDALSPPDGTWVALG